jgi:hypothetical protein
MFKLDLDPTFEATVVIPQPGGARIPVRVTFRCMDEDAYRAAYEATRAKPSHEFVGQLVSGWAETDDQAGRWQGMPMPCTPATLEQLAKKQPRSMQAFVDTFHHEILGLPLKN